MLVNCPGESALIDTTNIDGELVIKEKHPFVPNYSQEKFQFFDGVIKCQEPIAVGDSWNGTIKYDKKNHKVLTWRNMVLRGSILRSTEFMCGIVIYVGKETRIHMAQTS